MPSIIGGAWQRLGAGEEVPEQEAESRTFTRNKKTCHNYLWLSLGHIIGHIKPLFFCVMSALTSPAPLSKWVTGISLPYTYNFQDNGGALGEVTVTNTGAPTESRAGCYMSDCANNHAESSRVCGAGREMGSRGGGRVEVGEDETQCV